MNHVRMWLIVSALVSGAAPAWAATYSVAKTGNDSGPGSADRPFLTLAKGVGVLRPGDTLLVHPGTYAENINFLIPSGSSWTSPVTLRAADPAARPVLQPPTGSWVLYFSDGAHHIIVDGFVLDASRVTADGVKVTTKAHHIRIANSEIKQAPVQGVLTTNDATANEFINLDIHDNGTTDFDHGIYLATAGNVVRGCRIHRNAGWGVHVYNSKPSASNNTIRDNGIYDNARVGGRGDGILLSSGSGNVAYNNIVIGNRIGIRIDYGASSNAAYHNVVYANKGEFALLVGQKATGSIVRNNIVFANAVNRIDVFGRKSTVSHNLVSQDPLFVSPTSGDFRLQSGSPALDTGIATMVTTDIVGVSRPIGPAVDMGAYESKR